MIKDTKTAGADTTADETQDDAPAPPALTAPVGLANPSEGGSYIRQPDGSLVKQEG